MATEILVRDSVSRQPVGIFETFESFIWTDRYNEAGDFEITTKPTAEILNLLAKDNYLSIARSNKWMIIETRTMIGDSQDGYKLLIKGRSLESLLDRRIVLQQHISDNDQVEDGLYIVVSDNMINSPGQPQRNFEGFRFLLSNQPDIRIPRMSAKYIHREYIYDIVTYWTKPNIMGWQIHHNPSDDFFEMLLYYGFERLAVKFSPSLDNLLSSEWIDSYRNYKNYALVMGDNTEGPAHVVESKPSPDPSGLARRELFVDATNTSKFYAGSQTEMPVSQYLAILYAIGDGRRATVNGPLEVFMGEIYADVLYRYNEDYFLGDTVFMSDSRLHSGASRVVAYTFYEDLSGSYSYPTFEPA